MQRAVATVRRTACALRASPVLLSAFALLAIGVEPAPAASRASASVQVYFAQGEQLVPVARRGSSVEDAVRALLAGPTARERSKKLRTLVPSATPVRSVTVAGSTATVDLGERFAAGLDADSLSGRVAQVAATVTGLPGIKAVKLLVKGAVPVGLFPGFTTRFPITEKDLVTPTAPPPVDPGPGEGDGVSGATRSLQQRLADLGYLPPDAVDGVPGERTRFAVLAFQKWEGLGRDGVVGPATQAALERASRPTPRTSASGRRVEVLLDRQVGLVIDSGRVVRVLHVATGAQGFETPAGRFTVTRKEERSWSVPYKVWLPWASYFVGGVAFHESPDVPPAPASHGCVRVPHADAEWLYRQLPVGTPVTVVASS